MPIVSCRSTAWAIASLVPDPVGGAGQHRLRVLGEIEPEQPGEPAEAAEHLGPAGALDRRLHQLDGALAGLDVDAGRGVGRLGRPLGHGRDRASSARVAADRRPPLGLARRRRARLDALEHVLADDVGQRDRVLAVEAGPAQPGLGLLARGDQPVERDVAERVGTDRAPDALDVQSVGDQLGPRGEVDAVEARPLHRRRRDADVHLDGARLAQHPHQRALGVAAHDRVVDHDQPLAADDVAQRVELEPDAELTDRLRRLDEGPPDVGVLDQARCRTGCRTPRRSRSRRACPTRAPG